MKMSLKDMDVCSEGETRLGANSSSASLGMGSNGLDNVTRSGSGSSSPPAVDIAGVDGDGDTEADTKSATQTSNNDILEREDRDSEDAKSKPSKSPLESPELPASRSRENSVLKDVEEQTASNGNNLRRRNAVGVITGTTAQSQSAGAGGQGRVATGSDSVNARKNDSILAKHEALAKSKLKAPVLEFKDGIKDVPDEIKKKIRSKSPLEYKLVYLLTFSDIILSLC